MEFLGTFYQSYFVVLDPTSRRWEIRLGLERLKKKVGAVHNFGKARQSAIVYLFMSIARRVALSFVVTFGRTSFTGQLIFVNYCSLVLIALMSSPQLFSMRRDRVIELANEFTILLVYAHCLT